MSVAVYDDPENSCQAALTALHFLGLSQDQSVPELSQTKGREVSVSQDGSRPQVDGPSSERTIMAAGASASQPTNQNNNRNRSRDPR